MAASIGFDIFARDRASAAFDRVGNSAQASGRKMQVLAKVGRAAAYGLGAGLVLAGGAAVKFAKAAADDETSAAKMALQFRNSAHATAQQVAATEAWITKQGLAKGVADDDLRPALSKLVVATGSVTRAQHLAGLAMNISAGTGKDLQAVSTALAKAQNGSVGGLARLGVATKDAAGKTKTFAVIQKDLAKQFKGASASAAETASGKMRRLSVAFSEAQETVGYALLPVVTKLADFLVKDAIPAMGRAGDWASNHLAEPMQHVGDVLTSDVVPAFGKLLPVLDASAKAAGNLAQFVDEIPGPMKSIGLEVGAAALVFPRLASGLSSVGGGLTSTTAKVKQFRAEMTYTETRTAAVQAALGKLGPVARNAAGAGGLALIATSAQSTNRELGLLGGAAGGALSGFAVGGPWGAAVGAAGGALLGLYSSTKKSGHQFDLSSDQAKAYAATLDQVTGAAKASSRAQVLADLATNGTLKAGLAAGLGRQTLIDAALGKPAAISAVSTAISGLKTQVKDLKGQTQEAGTAALFGSTSGKKALADNSNAIKKNAADQKALTSLIGTQAATYAKQAREVRLSSAAVDGLGGRMKKIPRTLSTMVKADNLPKTTEGITALARQYNLTPKQIRTVFQLAGKDATLADARAIRAALDLAAKNRTTKITVIRNTAGGSAPGGGVKPGGRSADPADVGRYAADVSQRHARANGLVLSSVGAGLVTSLVDGITKKKVKLKDAFDAIKEYATSTASALQDALSERDSFAAGFSNFGTSVFGDDFGDQPVTVASILASQQSKAAAAASLSDDVRTLIGKGVSADVLQQIQSSGASGIKQIRALAGGSASDIAQFNALSAQTAGYYNTAGMSAGNAIYGGNVVVKQQADANAQALVNAFQAAGLGGGDNVTIQLEGQTITAR
jgi:hypothetical protein